MTNNDYERGYADGMAAALQAAGKPNDVHIDVQLDDHSAAVIIPNVVIQDNRIAQDEAGLRTYSVTWRRPTWAYAHDEIEATSIGEAMRIAKARVDRTDRADRRFPLGDAAGRDEPYFEADTDSMDPCDWISIEGEYDIDNPTTEHAEWEAPKLSPGVLVEALNRITSLANATTNDESNAMVLGRIFAIAHEALTKAVPS